MSTIRVFPALVALIALGSAVPLVTSAHDAAAEAKAKRHDYAGAEETAFGRAFDPAKASRVVKVRMDDTMRYSPGRLALKRGETVRFVVTNEGKLMHEFVLGTRKELERHAEMMRRMPGMEHDEPHMLHVAPGKTGEMGWHFTKAGEFFYGCLVPGHFEAGMVGTVMVADNAAKLKELPFVAGEVKRVDKEGGKITLKHDAIPNLGMDGMTMVFRVQEPAVLDKLKAGDKVKFKADHVKGAFTVTEIATRR